MTVAQQFSSISDEDCFWLFNKIISRVKQNKRIPPPSKGRVQEPSIKIKRGARKIPITVVVSMTVKTPVIRILRLFVGICWIVVKKLMLVCPRNAPIKNMVIIRLAKVGHISSKHPPVKAVKVSKDCFDHRFSNSGANKIPVALAVKNQLSGQ